MCAYLERGHAVQDELLAAWTFAGHAEDSVRLFEYGSLIGVYSDFWLSPYLNKKSCSVEGLPYWSLYTVALET